MLLVWSLENTPGFHGHARAPSWEGWGQGHQQRRPQSGGLPTGFGTGLRSYNPHELC